MEKCPVKEILKNCCCDFMGVKPEEDAMQCPTEIYNRCQELAMCGKKQKFPQLTEEELCMVTRMAEDMRR